MRKHSSVLTIALIFFVALSFTHCIGCDEGVNRDGTSFEGNSSSASFLHLDSEGVAALLNMNTDTLQSSRLAAFKSEGADSASESPVQGLDEATGVIFDALRCFTDVTSEPFLRDSAEGLSAECWSHIPRIVTIAQCGGYVYLVFEHPFMVRTVAPDGRKAEDYSDPWSASSPFTTQLMRSSEPIADYAAGDRLEASNLTGVLFSHEINTWDRRRNVQFDGDCNLYVTAHTPGTSNDKLIMIEPDAGEDDYTEIINANICYENSLVTTLGDVHYTGRTSTGGDCSGDSFYRMVTSDNVLVEITRDWWDYVFEPYPDSSGKVIFYGPDPTASGIASWDSACIFEFDNSKTGDARYTKLVDCTNDWWRYINDGPDTTIAANDTEKERCEQQYYTFRGSNRPEKILFFDRNVDGTEEICIVADTEYKSAGTWLCNICVSNGPACEDASGKLTGDTTAGACTGTFDANHTECYNDIASSACTIAQPASWELNHDWCQDPGTNWAQTYSALTCIKSDRTVELISSGTETVTNAWIAGDRLIYSSVDGGVYKLNEAVFDDAGTRGTPVTLIEGTEVYEVSVDPTEGTDRLLVNGLRFSDNSYIFGHYDFSSGTLDAESGLTGLVEAVLIIGGQ